MPVIVAGALFFILAFLTAALGALHLALGIGAVAFWNVAVGALYAFIGYWIMQREHRGYSWGLASSVISIASSLIQGASSPSLILVLLPFYVVAAVILWTNRAQFTR